TKASRSVWAAAVPARSPAISDPVRILRNTDSPLETESFRPAEARQRRRSGIAEGEVTERAAGLAADDQASDAAIDQHRAELAAVRELIDDCVGNDLDRAIDQDLLVGRALPPAGFERSFDHSDAKLACAAREIGR